MRDRNRAEIGNILSWKVFFEVFMDMIDQVVLRAEDELGIDLGDFNDKLQALMNEEHNRRNFILEGM